MDAQRISASQTFLDGAGIVGIGEMQVVVSLGRQC